ncbi:MAG: signal peptidase I [Microgenomates group bacterium]
MLKKKLKKAISIFQWVLTAVLVLVVLLLIFTTFNPVKSFQIFRVMSGSMEPKIKVGSVVFVQKVKPEILKEGNIITFTSREDPNITITHRLIAIEEKEGQTVFKTRGDANNSDDISETLPGQIKGRVVFSLPFLGYLSVWIRKPLGFGLLVILPAILIIISEILNIKKTIEKEVEKKYADAKGTKKKFRSLSLLIFFLLGISLFQIKPTNAYFSDVVVISGITFSMASDWTPPRSSVDNQPDYQNTSSFEVNYTASDSLSNIAEVKLYYSFNDGSWLYFGSVFPGTNPASGSFSFTSPDGDGFYEFKTVAIDQAGNEEDEDSNGVGDSQQLGSLFADASTVVDTTPPVTMLSTSDTMAVANELLYNGGFENGNLDGWIASSSGSDHQVTTEDKKTGVYSALIGFKTAAPSAEPAFDSIKQNISLPSWITSTLSFWYRLMTSTNVSGGFFDALILPPVGEPFKIAHDGWDDPEVFDTDLGWKNVTYQLNGLEGKDVGIEFKVTQPYKDYKTWVYLDDVKLTAATNLATTTTQLFLSGNDGGGSNNLNITYILDDNPPAAYPGGPITLGTPGEHTLKYFSTDEAGNSETPKQATISATAAPVDFGVVLNEFLPNPAGDDDAPKPNGEWVKLYNNSALPVDVNGWVLYDAYDAHELVISVSNSDNDGNPSDEGETIVPVGGILTVYRDGDGDFELNNTGGDTIRLYNAPIGSGGVLVDSFTYKINASESKSFKRQPDGTGGWKDPEVEPVVDFYLQPDKAAVGFKISGIEQYQTLSYEISYQAGDKQEGIMGSINLAGENEIIREGFTLGTCSAGGTCVYHSGIDVIHLKITLENSNSKTVLEKEINY